MPDQFSTLAEAMHQTRHWSTEEVAHIFGRLIIESLLENDLTEHLAERWGARAGHYGRLALQEQAMHAANMRVARDAWTEALGADASERRQFEAYMERRGDTITQPEIPELEFTKRLALQAQKD